MEGKQTSKQKPDKAFSEECYHQGTSLEFDSEVGPEEAHGPESFCPPQSQRVVDPITEIRDALSPKATLDLKSFIEFVCFTL